MASTVHYKFKSQKDYDSIEFDGMFISVGDLKRQITDSLQITDMPVKCNSKLFIKLAPIFFYSVTYVW